MDTVLAVDIDQVRAFLVAAARTAVWVQFAPPIANMAIPAAVRFAVALGLALPVAGQVTDVGGSSIDLLFAMVGSALIGFAMALAAMIAVAIFSSAGATIDTVTGLAGAAIFDPATREQTPVLGRVYSQVAVMVLLASGGHLVMVAGLYESFRAVPATPNLAVLATEVADNLHYLMAAALTVAGPVIAVLFLAEVIVALMARAAPQMNVFLVSLPAKIGASVLLVAAVIPGVPGAMSIFVADLTDAAARIAVALGA